MPPSWNINVQYIMDHFNIGRDKARSLLSNLVSERLLSVRKQRVQGQFSQPIYRLHLHRYPHPSENQNVDHSQDRSQDHDLDETRASTEFFPLFNGRYSITFFPINRCTAMVDFAVCLHKIADLGVG